MGRGGRNRKENGHLPTHIPRPPGGRHRCAQTPDKKVVPMYTRSGSKLSVTQWCVCVCVWPFANEDSRICAHLWAWGEPQVAEFGGRRSKRKGKKNSCVVMTGCWKKKLEKTNQLVLNKSQLLMFLPLYNNHYCCTTL